MPSSNSHVCAQQHLSGIRDKTVINQVKSIIAYNDCNSKTKK